MPVLSSVFLFLPFICYWQATSLFPLFLCCLPCLLYLLYQYAIVQPLEQQLVQHYA